MFKAFFTNDGGDTVQKLIEKVVDAVSNAKAEAQVGTSLYKKTINETATRMVIGLEN